MQLDNQLDKYLDNQLDNYISIDWDQVEREACRISLKRFIHLAWSLVESQPLKWNWHHDVLCDLLQKVTLGEIKRLLINIPPGTSKSLFVDVFHPAWEWAFYPYFGYLTSSYNNDNTIRDGLKLRKIITSEWYLRVFWNHYIDTNNKRKAVRLVEDQRAKIRFDTTEGGFRIASSIRGTGTGVHPHRISINDPTKAQDVNSVVLAEAIDYYRNTISTRMNNDPAIIITQQRLDHGDLSGYALDSSTPWTHLKLPMRYELTPTKSCDCHGANPDPLDIRTKDGELLWSGVYTEEIVSTMENELGLDAPAQLQQSPVVKEGFVIKRSWFEIVDTLPADLEVVGRGIDKSGSVKSTSDYTGLVKLARDHKGGYYILHVIKEKTEDVDELIYQTAELDGHDCIIREEQEPGGSGRLICLSHAKMLDGYDYDFVPVQKDKLTRGGPFISQCRAGNVKLLRGSWNQMLLDDFCSITAAGTGSFDVFDAATVIYNAIAITDNTPISPVWGRRRLP